MICYCFKAMVHFDIAHLFIAFRTNKHEIPNHFQIQKKNTPPDLKYHFINKKNMYKTGCG